jgi:hypothetical protein
LGRHGIARTRRGGEVKNPDPKDPALDCPLRGLQWSFPSCGSLVESSDFGLQISDFGLKLIKAQTKDSFPIPQSAFLNP